VFDIKYHFVWITKYRYKILRGRVAERVRDLLDAPDLSKLPPSSAFRPETARSRQNGTDIGS
jgi:hypothetical protein